MTVTILGRRAMVVLKWQLVAATALAVTCAMVLEGDRAKTALLVLWCSASAIVIAPGVIFLAHATRTRGIGIAPETRKSATGSGIATMILGRLTLSVPDEALPGRVGDVLFDLLPPLAVLIVAFGAVIIGRAWTMRLTEPGAGLSDVALPRGRVVMSGLLVAFVVTNVVPAFRGLSMWKAGVTVMKSDLRNLVALQEGFLADSGRYASALSALRFAPSSRANPPTLVVGKNSWSATNTFKRLRGVTCGVAVGTANPVSGETANAGEPACHGP